MESALGAVSKVVPVLGSKGLRRTVASVVGAAIVLLVPATAFAHVTVNPGEAAQGGYAKLAFRVPNERDDASTTKLEVSFPTATPLASVSVRPTDGWTYSVTESPLPTPVTTDDGDTITQAITLITWTADDAESAIKPGEFAEFEVSAGPLPDDVDSISFPTLQAYSHGEVARWIDIPTPGGAEPDRPAPTLTLVPSTGDDHHGTTDTTEATEATDTTGDDTTDGTMVISGNPTEQAGGSSGDAIDGTARTLGIVGIVIGVLGAGLGVYVLSRRRPPTA